jgi:hypothetical protein
MRGGPQSACGAADAWSRLRTPGIAGCENRSRMGRESDVAGLTPLRFGRAQERGNGENSVPPSPYPQLMSIAPIGSHGNGWGRETWRFVLSAASGLRIVPGLPFSDYGYPDRTDDRERQAPCHARVHTLCRL